MLAQSAGKGTSAMNDGNNSDAFVFRLGIAVFVLVAIIIGFAALGKSDSSTKPKGAAENSALASTLKKATGYTYAVSEVTEADRFVCGAKGDAPGCISADPYVSSRAHRSSIWNVLSAADFDSATRARLHGAVGEVASADIFILNAHTNKGAQQLAKVFSFGKRAIKGDCRKTCTVSEGQLLGKSYVTTQVVLQRSDAVKPNLATWKAVSIKSLGGTLSTTLPVLKEDNVVKLDGPSGEPIGYESTSEIVPGVNGCPESLLLNFTVENGAALQGKPVDMKILGTGVVDRKVQATVGPNGTIQHRAQIFDCPSGPEASGYRGELTNINGRNGLFVQNLA